MKQLFAPFLRGILFAVPIVATIALLRWVFARLDALLRIDALEPYLFPGSGVVLLFLIVSGLGLLSRFVIARWVADRIGGLFRRVPPVKFVYDAMKDLVEAVLGEKSMFDRPVLVQLESPLGGELLGFVTSDELAWMGRAESVSVYLPQSFGWAGQLVVLPADRVAPLDVDPSRVTQFLVSGGISRGSEDAPSDPPA